MAAQDGRDFVLKVSNNDSPETFTTVGGFRTNTLTLNEQTVDVTNKSSASKFRELLRAGVKSVSLGGDGVFTDSAKEEALRANFFGSAVLDYQVVVPDWGTFQGAFVITSLQYTGPDNDAVTYSVGLESAGAITFTAA